MRTLPIRRLLALVAIALLASACTGGRNSSKPATTTPASRPARHSHPPIELSTLVADVTPPGWVPVDFGDAQLSVPANWQARYDFEQSGDSVVGDCALPIQPGVVYLGEWATCAPLAGTSPASIVVLAPLTSARRAALRTSRVNGILVDQVANSNVNLVPDLEVMIRLSGPSAGKVLATLTRSPAAVVLAPGPPPVVPRSWRTVKAGGVEFAVPPGWPTMSSSVYGTVCAGAVVGPRDRVIVDSDAFDGLSAGCPTIFSPPTPPPPADGLVLDLHPIGGWPPSTAVGICLRLGAAMACPYARPVLPADHAAAEIDILFVRVTVPGRPHEQLEIGLAGNGIVARTVLYSLRAGK